MMEIVCLALLIYLHIGVSVADRALNYPQNRQIVETHIEMNDDPGLYSFLVIMLTLFWFPSFVAGIIGVILRKTD